MLFVKCTGKHYFFFSELKSEHGNEIVFYIFLFPTLQRRFTFSVLSKFLFLSLTLHHFKIRIHLQCRVLHLYFLRVGYDKCHLAVSLI